MSVFSHWSRDDTWASQPRWDTTQSPTTGLSFLITAATSGLQSYSYASLGLSRLQVATAGLGAASVVQIGKMPNGKLVAVKVDRESSRPLAQKEPAHFERYLGRLDLEIRILTNKCVKQNKNILNILGFGMDERGGEPSCFLVEEYSNLGDLKAFLLSGSSISVHQQLEFGLDIAKALEALHSLKVCHGDVKLENALVFEREDKPGWLLKLSDFSHAIVAIEGDPEGPVTLGFGTPLLRAPELYNGNASREGCFNIAAALKADTFSFGLFLWEVIKLGVTYFEDSWLTDPTQGYSVHDLEAKEAFLSQLSPGAFWRLVVGFLKSRKDLDEVSLRAVGDVLNRTLQYEPSKRSQIGEIAKILRDSVQSV